MAVGQLDSVSGNQFIRRTRKGTLDCENVSPNKIVFIPRSTPAMAGAGQPEWATHSPPTVM